jgi:hypothetical protein
MIGSIGCAARNPAMLAAENTRIEKQSRPT